VGGVRAALCGLILGFALAACGSSEKTPATTTGHAQASCAKSALALQSPGQLTIGTDKPAYPPYYEGNDPTNGKGFESAVAYAVAKQLGFSNSQVKWTVVPFNSSYAPGPKHFDFDINKISITPPRAKHVDFSSPYFTAPQAVVALKKSAAANATSLAELSNAKLGVQVGTTSLDAVDASIKPKSQPQVYNDSNDTVRALKQGRIDAIVVDLPTAFYITAAQVQNAKIVGQFAAPGGDRWGMLLAKGSKLTPCLNKALAKVSASGQLKQLQDKWMGGDAAPALR
jgi:polar amino acid transport system substrate-binding protein